MTISNLKPFMAYLTFDQYARLKRFASKNDVPMAQVIRESIDARIAAGDRYSHGYNTALKDAMRSVAENKAARMRFPSGKSFADLVKENQRKAQAAKDKATLIWASERGAGTQPASFPEVSKAPQKSQKNIKR